jgi:hypothetical protein
MEDTLNDATNSIMVEDNPGTLHLQMLEALHIPSNHNSHNSQNYL